MFRSAFVTRLGQCRQAGTAAKRLARSILAVVVFSVSAHGQQTASFSGRVLDKMTHQPIPGANVLLDQAGLGAGTNSEGYFELKHVPAGTYGARVSVLGYIPESRVVTLHEGEEKTVLFQLSETVYELNPVTVTATRVESLVSDVSSSVDVISFRDLEQKNVQNISEAIRTIPGVFVKDYGTLSDLKTVSVRGSTSSQVLVLVDGQRLNNAQSGDVDMSSIPIGGIEKVEVVRGGASALYGADAVGGVIHIITRSEPYQVSSAGYAKLLAGSFGTRAFEGGGTYAADRFFSLVSYRYLTSKGNFTYTSPLGEERRRTNSDVTSHGLFGKGAWNFGDEALHKTLSLSGQYFYSEGGIPGSTNFPTPQARRKNKDKMFNLVYQQKVGTPYNNIRVQSYYHNLEYSYDDPVSYVPEHTYHHNTAWGAEVQGRILFGSWNAITSGYAYRADRLSSTSLDKKQHRGLHSLYVQDEMSLALPEGGFLWRAVMMPALRWDKFTDFGEQVSPKIGLMVMTGESWQASVKGNYSSSFRAPSFSDLYWPKDPYTRGNPDLRPERGKDFDVGFMFMNPSLLGMAAGVTYFNNSVRDLILWQPDAAGVWTPQNLGKASIRGFETKLSVSPWTNLLRFEWNYTYLDARNKTDVANQYDKQLPYRPQNVHNLSVRLGVSRIYVLAAASYSGRRYVSADNAVSLDPYRVIDIIVGYTPPLYPSWIETKLEVKNLGNLKYQAMDGFPMPGREFRLSLEVKLPGIADKEHNPEVPSGGL